MKACFSANRCLQTRLIWKNNKNFLQNCNYLNRIPHVSAQTADRKPVCFEKKIFLLQNCNYLNRIPHVSAQTADRKPVCFEKKILLQNCNYLNRIPHVSAQTAGRKPVCFEKKKFFSKIAIIWIAYHTFQRKPLIANQFALKKKIFPQKLQL